MNFKFYKSIMTAIHEVAAIAHTLGVLRDEDVHRGSHDAKSWSCRDLDSGGPLVCRSGDHYILAGVVSWGVPCSRHQQPLPSVFAKVTYFLPWIESTINSET